MNYEKLKSLENYKEWYLRKEDELNFSPAYKKFMIWL